MGLQKRQYGSILMSDQDILTDLRARKIVNRLSKALQHEGVELLGMSVSRILMPSPDGIHILVTFLWDGRQGGIELEVPFEDDLAPHIDDAIVQWKRVTGQTEIR